MKFFYKYIFDKDVEKQPDLRPDYEYRIGDIVKVVIPGECFWAIITKIDGNTLFATIDNKLISPQFKYKQTIVFSRKLVLAYDGNIDDGRK